MSNDTTTTIINWLNLHPYLFSLLIIWSLTLKGISMWKAAEREHKAWYIVLLVINSLGILDLIYIFAIAPRYNVEIIEG